MGVARHQGIPLTCPSETQSPSSDGTWTQLGQLRGLHQPTGGTGQLVRIPDKFARVGLIAEASESRGTASGARRPSLAEATRPSRRGTATRPRGTPGPPGGRPSGPGAIHQTRAAATRAPLRVRASTTGHDVAGRAAAGQGSYVRSDRFGSRERSASPGTILAGVAAAGWGRGVQLPRDVPDDPPRVRMGRAQPRCPTAPKEPCQLVLPHF
jgi:hypothetical protein